MSQVGDRYCPQCQKLIKAKAAACPHCGLNLARPFTRKPTEKFNVEGSLKPLLVVGGCLLAMPFAAQMNGQPEQAAVTAAESQAAVSEPDDVAARAEERRKGFHCLSTWDGSNLSLVKKIKDNLRNPGSFEHADTQIGPELSSGYHPIRMKYRAENGFGGMNVEEAVGAVDHQTCEATVITSEAQMDRLLPTPD